MNVTDRDVISVVFKYGIFAPITFFIDMFFAYITMSHNFATS